MSEFDESNKGADIRYSKPDPTKMDGFYKYTAGKGGPKGDGLNGGRWFAKNPDWEKEVDAFRNKEMGPGEFLTLGNTPHVLQMLGAKDLPIQMSQNTANKIMEDKHDFSPNFMKLIPEAIEDPIAVFLSANKKDEGQSRIVLTQMTTKSRERVMVSIRLDSKHGRNVVNAVSSAYGRPNKDYQKWSDMGIIINLNEKKNQRLGTIFRKQYPTMVHQNADSQEFKTDKDLVKFKASKDEPRDIRYSKPLPIPVKRPADLPENFITKDDRQEVYEKWQEDTEKYVDYLVEFLNERLFMKSPREKHKGGGIDYPTPTPTCTARKGVALNATPLFLIHLCGGELKGLCPTYSLGLQNHLCFDKPKGIGFNPMPLILQAIYCG